MEAGLRDVLVGLNHRVREESSALDGVGHMGATVTMALIRGSTAHIAHMGDSRAYIIRGGKIRALTYYHSVVGELVRRREITEDDARAHPHRHVLTRALGVRTAVAADLAEMTPRDGDIFAMCSDGLTNHVRDEEIAGLVGGTPDLQDGCDALVRCANSRGGEDNTTVVLVRCEKGGEEVATIP